MMRTAFAFEAEMVERMTQARFLVSRAENFEQAAGLFSDLLQNCLTISEKLDLVSMLREVASVEGPSEAQLSALRVLQQRLALAPSH